MNNFYIVGKDFYHFDYSELGRKKMKINMKLVLDEYMFESIQDMLKYFRSSRDFYITFEQFLQKMIFYGMDKMLEIIPFHCPECDGRHFIKHSDYVIECECGAVISGDDLLLQFLGG